MLLHLVAIEIPLLLVLLVHDYQVIVLVLLVWSRAVILGMVFLGPSGILQVKLFLPILLKTEMRPPLPPPPWPKPPPIYEVVNNQQ